MDGRIDVLNGLVEGRASSIVDHCSGRPGHRACLTSRSPAQTNDWPYERNFPGRPAPEDDIWAVSPLTGARCGAGLRTR